MWFKTVTTTPSKVILKSTGQALPGLPGPWSEKISDWSTVSPGGEAPFEFTSGEKLRHRVSGFVNQKFRCSTGEFSISPFFSGLSITSWIKILVPFQLFFFAVGLFDTNYASW